VIVPVRVRDTNRSTELYIWVGAERLVDMASGGPHTDKVIFRPSVTSSGRIRKKSRRQAWLCTSLPIVETTVPKTFFHDRIWMAKMAKHTQS
jgi:hypothetical protein